MSISSQFIHSVEVGDIAEVLSSKRIYLNDYVDYGVPFYRSKEIIDKIHGRNVKETIYISRDKYKELSSKFGAPKKGDILVTAVGTLGKVYLVEGSEEFYFKDGNLLWLRNFKDVDSRYLVYYFSSSLMRKQIKSIFNGSSQKALTIEKVRKLKIVLPPLGEQIKISETLNEWDKAIKLKRQLIEQKQQQKKVLMHIFFNQEAKNLYFQTECTEEKLGDIMNISSGKSKSKYIEEGGSNVIIDMGAISREGMPLYNKRTNHMNGFLKKGELVMAKDDIGGGNIIGKTIYIDQNDKYILGDHVYKLEINKGDPRFINKLINSPQINKSFRRKANGTAQLGLSKKDIESQKVFLPCLEEQRYIDDILSTLDTEISLIKEEIELLGEQKKGLMQRLLTGEVRVSV